MLWAAPGVRRPFYSTARARVEPFAPDPLWCDVVTPLGTAKQVRFAEDALFVVIPQGAGNPVTRLVGIDEANEIELPTSLLPVAYGPKVPPFDPVGFSNVRFIGWVHRGKFFFDGAMPRAAALYLCYNRQGQAGFTLALEPDLSRDVRAVVASTRDEGGLHWVSASETIRLWNRIGNRQLGAMANMTPEFEIALQDTNFPTGFAFTPLSREFPPDQLGALCVIHTGSVSDYATPRHAAEIAGAPNGIQRFNRWSTIRLARVTGTRFNGGTANAFTGPVRIAVDRLPPNVTAGMHLYAKNVFQEGAIAYRRRVSVPGSGDKTMASSIVATVATVAAQNAVVNDSFYCGPILSVEQQFGGHVLTVFVMTGQPLPF